MDVLVEFGLKVHRGLIAEGAVEPHAVVKRLRSSQRGLVPRREVPLADEFTFEGAPEAFHGGVVITVAFAAHAGNDARLC